MDDAQARLRTALADRYRLERQLGEGGMATVYLAHDLRHDRRVAIKVLKPELAAVLGAERFLVEIRTTANLQHPHILPLFDSGEADGFLYYVMPFIDGETLRAKLDRETQLGVDEAVKLATDVADALHTAHEHGVIHRDIKPENILLANGRPMVADFGIALAVSAASAGRMTETGLSLGTPHYMSPEQATAEKELTARSDQYALACVLYEMLAGEPPHAGGSAQQVIMKIITEVPADLTMRRRTVPPHVAAAVAQALEKLPADRFESIAAFAAALTDPQRTAHVTRVINAGPTGGRRIGTPTIAAIALLAVAAAWGWLRPGAPASVLRYELPDATVANTDVGGISLDVPAPVGAPDGSFLVYAAVRSDGAPGVQLYRKRRDEAPGVPIAGTEDAGSFTLSPDGRAIAFTAGAELRTVPVAGGVPEVVVAGGVYGPGGVAWRDDGSLLFTSAGGGLPTVKQVMRTGGEERTVIVNATGAAALPVAVPGTSLVFYAECSSPLTCDLHVIDLDDGEARPVVKGVAFSAWSTTGHLLYVQSGRLIVSAFDTDAVRLVGDPVELATGVAGTLFPLSLSAAGTLSLKLGSGSVVPTYDLVWIDRSGRITPLDTTWQFRLTAGTGNVGWALSPDGTRLAIGLNTEAGDDVWVRTLPDGPLTRPTLTGGPNMRPRWTADGRAVTIVRQAGRAGVVLHRADGIGGDSVLLGSLVDEAMLSPDGRWLLVRAGAAGSVRGGRDILGRRLTGPDSSLVPLVATRFDEEAIAVSPDGRWLAYQSDESGRNEVYVRPFPRTDAGRWQVSLSGGGSPVWSRDGRELFFLGSGRDMMSVRVARTGPGDASIAFDRPEALFRVPDDLLGYEYAFYTPWDVAPDGRFLMARTIPTTGAEPTRVVIAEQWHIELRERLQRASR